MSFKEDLADWWEDARPGSNSPTRGDARMVIFMSLPLVLIIVSVVLRLLEQAG